MTARTRRTPNTPADLEALGRQVGTDNAGAIANFVDGRIAAAVDTLSTRVDGVFERLERLEAAGVDVAAAVEAANRAADAADALSAAVADGQAVDPADEAAAQAAAADAEAQAAAAAAQAAAVAPAPQAEPTAPAVVPTGLAGQVAALGARVDQHDNAINDLRVVGVGAWAVATAAVDGDQAGRRAGLAGLASFAVMFLLYGLWVLVTPGVWDWNWAVGLPAVVAGMVAAIVWALSRPTQSAAASAAAEAVVARWAADDGAAAAPTPQPAPGAQAAAAAGAQAQS